MNGPSPQEVRDALAGLDVRQEKIVAGVVTVMMKNPQQVREREWIAEQLAEITLLAGDFDADSADQAVRTVQEYLEANTNDLLNASFLLFQRVGLDLAPRAEEGFGLDDAVRCALGYLPSLEEVPKDADRQGRDLGEQPLARMMAERGLKPNDLVEASTEQLTHKMVTRAMKGRRLTANTMGKVHRAWNKAARSANDPRELFDYEP